MDVFTIDVITVAIHRLGVQTQTVMSKTESSNRGVSPSRSSVMGVLILRSQQGG